MLTKIKITGVRIKAGRVDFRAKNAVKYEGHFMIIKEAINQKGITILTFMYLMSKVSKYMKRKLIEPEE